MNSSASSLSAGQTAAPRTPANTVPINPTHSTNSPWAGFALAVALVWLVAQNASAQITVLFEGFEGVFPGNWSVGDANPSGTAAYWRDVNLTSFGSPPTYDGSWAGYCAGVGFGGSTTSPTYQNSMDAYMSQTIDLSGYTTAALSFAYVIPSLQSGGLDKCRVYLDSTLLFERTNAVTNWTATTIDLTAYVGGAHTLKFEFISDASGTAEGWYLDDILVAASTAAAPGNDRCSGAIAMAPGTVYTMNTAGATATGDPTPICEGNFAKGVWYSFTAPASETVVISTCGSDFDTLLQVYTGGCGALTPVSGACNDDNGPACATSRASVSFAAIGGTTYWILAGGFGPDSGNLSIVASLLAPPSNDQCADAIAMAANTIYTVNTAYATATGDPAPSCQAAFGNGVWYTFAPAASGTVTISTCGSDFDTVLQVYTGSCGALSPLAGGCNDDDGPSCAGNRASVSFSANAGTTYRILAGGHGGASGNLTVVAIASTGAGLVILPSFDSSITSDPQAATIEATINAAIAVYESDFSDPLTVSIKFQKMNTGLARSGFYFDPFSYSAYRAALSSHATSADDVIALAHLPNTASNPVNGDPNVYLHLPVARALGFSAPPPAGEPDGTVYLNTALMNLSASETNASKYSLFAAVSHEIDEVLALSSGLNGLNNGAPPPSGPIDVEDLFRYDQNGLRSFTTALNALSFFSLDGLNDLAQFNQYDGGDFQDWYSYNGGQTPQVQDAFAAPGAAPVPGVELRVLDVLGFHRVITLLASAGAGGTISPTGRMVKNPGDAQIFTASPNVNYAVDQWLLDGNAVQAGGATYTLLNLQANHSVQVAFVAVVQKANQTISFAPLLNRALGEAPFTLTATASSGLPVSFSVLSGPASLAGNVLSLVNTGQVSIRAAQSGDANYNAAPNVDRAFTIYPRPALSVARSGQNVLISWATNVPGFALETATNLVTTTIWSAAAPGPSVVNGQNTVTNALTNRNQFYRLKL